MKTFSALLALCAGNSPVPGEFPAQRPVTRSFDVFFDLRLIKQLSKQSRGWSFETLSHPLWRHRNVLGMLDYRIKVFILICVWINGCVNNRETGDLRRYRAHYDVTLMFIACLTAYSDFHPRNIKFPHYWPFARGIDRLLVDSPHKGPVTLKAFSCHDVFMKCKSLGIVYISDPKLVITYNRPRICRVFHLEISSWYHDDVIKWGHFPRYWALWGESTGGRWFPSQTPMTWSFDVFFDLHLNKRLSKQSRRWWFETPSHSLWRHCNDNLIFECYHPTNQWHNTAFSRTPAPNGIMRSVRIMHTRKLNMFL